MKREQRKNKKENRIKTFFILFSSLLFILISCNDMFNGDISPAKGEVVVRIAGNNGRTIMPATPVFNRYELLLENEDGSIILPDTDGIEDAGVQITLTEGTWIITINAYQDILNDGVGIKAATGSSVITVNSQDSGKIVTIELKPIAIKDSEEPGLFSYEITLPEGLDTFNITLKNDSDEAIEITDTSGSINLAPGYYDLGIILTKNGMYAGLFESVHIYSGLESPAVIDLSDIAFADKVYLAGTLGGLRIGTIKIIDTETQDVIKELQLDSDTLNRSADWILDIPAVNIGKTVSVVLEFADETAVREIAKLESNGKADIELNLIPVNVYRVNVAPWYSTAVYTDDELVLDFPFDITFNIKKIGDKSFYFPEITASQFSIQAENEHLPAINEIGLYKVNDRTDLISAITQAREKRDSVQVSEDGTDVPLSGGWVTADDIAEYQKAIDAAQAALTDPQLTDEDIEEIVAALNEAGDIFFSAIRIETLGAPVLLLAPGYSYSTITAQWTKVQKADAYRVEYKYAGEENWTLAETAGTDTIELTFRPKGYNEIANSGKELQVRVIAVNTATGTEIASNMETKRLVGPAQINITATQAVYADYIEVSWNKVEGAAGYYVSQRRFNMNNTVQEGSTAQVYISGSADARQTWQDTCTIDEEKAWGYPYRYIVIPVMNESDVPQVNYTDGTYTLADITLSGTDGIEQTGFTFGYGWNVAATKGTYASSGNVNDGILVKWDALPFREGLTFTVYRKALNADTWDNIGTTTATNLVDTPSRGIVYEYAVGINGTHPYASDRFMTSPAMVQTDTGGRLNREGFMQALVKMNLVTRGEDAELNAIYGERVTWETPAGYDWGLSYTVYVYNRNINANWHIIADNVTATNDGSGFQSAVFTPSNTGSTANTANIQRNFLFVLRDYKHFYKARSYVTHDGIKIYSPDPDWTYQNRWGTTQAAHIAASEQMQNEYVKWGAREVSAREFAQIASMYVARGVQRRRGGTWTSTLSWGSANASGNNGGSGYVRDKSNAGVNQRDWEFRNYKDDLETRAGGYITFLTVDGNMWMATRASGWPQRYGRATDNYRENRLWITGPWDTPHLYNGAIHFGGNGTTDPARTESNGNIHVIYPSGTSQQTVIVHGENDTPLAWDYGLGNSNNRHRLDDNNWR